MKRLIVSIPIVLALLSGALTGCSPDDQGGKTAKSYTNPVTSFEAADPCLIKADDGYFYMFCSEGTRGLPVYKTQDLVNWQLHGIALRESQRPNLDASGKGALWAPEIAKVGQKYVLYYSYYSPLDEMKWGIGAATASNPAGPWVNQGKVFLGEDVDVCCSIDPCFFSENGKNYLIWGSYFGIWAIELTENGLKIKDGAEKVRLAGVDGYGLEGAMIYKKDGKYYLFVSEGGTGYDDHYKLGAYRSDNLLGPYLNKAGENAAKGGGADFFLRAGSGFRSPGHCSEIITDGKGNDWLFHHAFIDGHPEKERLLMLEPLTWTDGWPSISDGTPVTTSNTVPVIEGSKVNK